MPTKPLKDFNVAIEMLFNETRKPGDLQQKLIQVGKAANYFFSSDICVIFPINPISGEFIQVPPTIVGELKNTQPSDFKKPRKDGLAIKVLNTENLLYVNDLSTHEEYQSEFSQKEKIKSFIAVALCNKQLRKPLAVMYLDYKYKFDLKDQDKLDINLFSRLASAELRETWFLSRYQEISEVGDDITSRLSDVDTIFYDLVQHVEGIFDINDSFILGEYKPQSDNFTVYIYEQRAFKKEENYSPEDKSFARYITNYPVTIWIQNLQEQIKDLPEGLEVNYFPDSITDIKSLIFTPLIIRNQYFGYLSLQSQTSFAYSEEDKYFLEVLSNHVALSINSIRLIRALEDLDEAGRFLTQQLDNDQLFQSVVDRIRDITKSDIVSLMPYEQYSNNFKLPPVISGQLIDNEFPLPTYSRPDDMATLLIKHKSPSFCLESSKLFYLLGGNEGSRKGSFEIREKIKSTAAIPLIVGDEAVGSLFVNFRKKQTFDPPQKRLISSLASYAAIAIRNSRQYTELDRRSRNKLDIVRRIDTEISQTLDLKNILDIILTLVLEHIPATEASILLYDANKHTLRLRAGIDRRKSYQGGEDCKDQLNGITHWAFEHFIPVRVDNVHIDPEWKHIYIGDSDIYSELDVPLRMPDGTCIGIMNFESTKEGAFSQEDQDFLTLLAGQAVLAISNANLYEREKRISEERKALIEINKQLILEIDEQKIFELIIKKATDVTNTSFGTLNTCDPVNETIHTRAGMGLSNLADKNRQTYNDGIVGLCARDRRIINAPNLTQPPWNSIYLPGYFENMKSELAVPIQEGNELRGIISLESEEENHFSQDDERFMNALADLAVIAIQNANRYKALELSRDREKLASIGACSGNFVHKINNPLGKIKSYINFVERDCQEQLENSKELNDNFSNIKTVLSNAFNMVQDVNKQARVQMFEAVNINQQMDEALREIVIPSNVVVINRIPKQPALPIVLASDQIKQVFIDVLNNGIRAMEYEGGGLIIDGYVEDHWVTVTINDSGIGIPKGWHEEIFKVFTTGIVTGHGLGLWYSKAYIEGCGGQITATQGKDGIGTKITIRLPCQ